MLLVRRALCHTIGIPVIAGFDLCVAEQIIRRRGRTCAGWCLGSLSTRGCYGEHAQIESEYTFHKNRCYYPQSSVRPAYTEGGCSARFNARKPANEFHKIVRLTGVAAVENFTGFSAAVAFFGAGSRGQRRPAGRQDLRLRRKLLCGSRFQSVRSEGSASIRG